MQSNYFSRAAIDSMKIDREPTNLGSTRQSRVQLRDHAERDSQCRPPHHRSLDQLGYGMCRLTRADRGKRAKRGSLLRHHAATPEAGEAPAQRRKGRNGRGEAPSRCFGSERRRFGEACFRYRGDQHLVFHICQHERASRAPWRGQFAPHAGVRKEIELLFAHPIMMRGAAFLSKRSMAPSPSELRRIHVS
jgi:hypothetical protein